MQRHISIPPRGNARLPALISVEQIQKGKLCNDSPALLHAHAGTQSAGTYLASEKLATDGKAPRHLSAFAHSPAERLRVPIPSPAACRRFSPPGEILHLCKRSRAGCPAAV